jgi:UMF1 family MFS transporter
MKPPVFKREIISWCMYDWANSAFAVIVLAGFFPILFKMFWNHGEEATTVTARLGAGNACAGIVIACLSPVFGAFADVGRAKKKFLAVFMVAGIAATAFLPFVGSGLWAAALLMFVLANIGFSCGNLFYDSLIVDITEKGSMDFVSSLGYAAGYAGGGILLLGNFFLSTKPSFFGFGSQTAAMLASFLTVAGWWLVFSAPLFLFVKEKKGPVRQNMLAVMKKGFSQLGVTAGKIARNRLILVFLAAYWLYMDGVYTFIMMSVDFGMSLGFKPAVMVVTLLVVQFVAFPSSIGFGYLARFLGTGKTILAGIIVYFLVCAAGSFLLRSPVDFLVLSVFVAMAQGGIQALSRSYFAKIIPQEEAAEYFGFLNVIGRFSVILGPVLVGGVALLARHAGAASPLASRIGMSSITMVFAAGALLLMLAEKERTRRLSAA